ncbi:MAG TPA: zf-HC2 domain-containing protein [Ardenticatenaceae bacterium]|nr:zf-HC2 domain-containing protein [Ardenticatenaceae bacterium]
MVNFDHLDPDVLSAYLDEEVTPAERTLVEEHLARCGTCRQELESLRWTVDLLQRMPPVELPRTFYLTEADVAPPERSRRAALPGWLQPLLTFSTAASAVLCTLLLLSGLNLGGAGAPAPPTTNLTARAPETSAQESAPRATEVAAFAVEQEATQVLESQESAAQAEGEAAEDAPVPEAAEVPAEEAAEEPEEELAGEAEEEPVDGGAAGAGSATTPGPQATSADTATTGSAPEVLPTLALPAEEPAAAGEAEGEAADTATEVVPTPFVELEVTAVVEVERVVTTVVEIEKEVTTVVEGESVLVTAMPRPGQATVVAPSATAARDEEQEVAVAPTVAPESEAGDITQAQEEPPGIVGDNRQRLGLAALFGALTIVLGATTLWLRRRA